MAVGGWYIEDREIEISARRVMKIIESTNDPRSEYYDLMRRESMPADELMGRRMEIGVVAVLGQLRAKRNWHRIMREWVYADEPATELGEQEWEYFEGRGRGAGPGTGRATPDRRARDEQDPTRLGTDQEELGRCCARTRELIRFPLYGAVATVAAGDRHVGPGPLPVRAGRAAPARSRCS